MKKWKKLIQEMNNLFFERKGDFAEEWMVSGIILPDQKTTTTLGWKGKQCKIVLRINFEEERPEAFWKTSA